MNRNEPALPAANYTFIILGVLLGLLYYAADSIIDTIIFNNTNLLDELLHPTPHEVYMRLTVLLLFVAFGVFAHFMVRRELLINTAKDFTESTLQDTEIRLQTVFDLAPESIHVVDTEGRITASNRFACESSGYTEEELRGKCIRDFLTKESQIAFDSEYQVLTTKGFNRANYHLVSKDGDIKKVDCVATAIRDGNGEINSFVIIHRDMTERMQAALALEDSERRFQAIFNSTFQYMGLIDPDGILLEANQTALDFHGVTATEVIGLPMWEAGLWASSPELQDRLRTAIHEAAKGNPVRCEVELVRKNGEPAIIDFSLKPVSNEQGETVLIIPEGRDITARKHSEEKAKRQQRELALVMRMSNIGEMAAGLAHELNQPLAALVSYCDTANSLLVNQPTQQEKISEILNRASEQAHRASSIVQHFRDFPRKGKTRTKPVDLDQVIRELSDFLGPELKNAGVKLELRLDSQEHKVTADRIQIEQVLINLIWNSMEAIHKTGITDGRLVVQTRLLPGGRVQVTVADNGPGVDPAIAATIFDTFQTNKASGMGMGLSISRSIIEAHGENLWRDKEYQDGALFGFELPLSQ